MNVSTKKNIVSAKRKQTDNAHFAWKVILRREAVSSLDTVRVLDCFAGCNRLWTEVGYDYYHGLEQQKGKGRLNIHADNLRIIPVLDLSLFNVIDLDSYGVPGNQLLAIIKNKTLPEKMVIVYTAICAPLAESHKSFLLANGILPDTYRKCPTLFNNRLGTIFDTFLFRKLGVERDHSFSIKEGAYWKRYGYFTLYKKRIMC